jgi:hypothetical protein
MRSTTIDSTSCWICGREVSLKASKSDEHGRPVHEECRVTRVTLESEAVRSASQRKSA